VRVEAERRARLDDLAAACGWVELLRLLRPPAAACIIYYGNRIFGVGERREVLAAQKADVLMAFLKLNPMDEPQLIDQSGYPKAARILAGLRDQFGGMFAPYIVCPGGRGQGGYKVEIRDESGAGALPRRT
jgi:hypothetical protein